MTVSEKSRWLILLVVSSALFLIVIDMTVLYTALPSLARDLGTDASEKLWIINAYALVVAGRIVIRVRRSTPFPPSICPDMSLRSPQPSSTRT
jgi:MFS family permease